jgi:hypothetical protein
MSFSKTPSRFLGPILAILICAAAGLGQAADLVGYRGTYPGCAELTVGVGQPVTFSGGAASVDGTLGSVHWLVDNRWIEHRPIRNRWSEDELRFVHRFLEGGPHEVAMVVVDDHWNWEVERWTLHVVVDRTAYAPKACQAWPQGASARITAGVPETFTATVTDIDADVHGIEWYVDGQFIDAKYREEVDGDGHLTIFSRRFTLHEAARSAMVSAVPFDREGHYGPSISWTVDVDPRPRFLYVGFFDRILPSAREREKLVDFVRENGITHVALYRLHWLFPASCSDECCGDSMRNLAELILALREAGALRIYAAVGSASYYRNHVEPFVSFHKEYAQGRAAYADGPDGFDGVVTEREFWNKTPRSEAFEDFMQQIRGLREFLSPAGMELNAYVTKVSYVEAETIAALADRVLLASYAGSPASAYDKALDYLPRFQISRARPTEVWPLLSAENETDKRSFCRLTNDDQAFLGDWLNDVNRWDDPLAKAEDGFLDRWKEEQRSWKYGVHVGGFAWFEYNVLEDDLRSTDSNVAPRVCHWYDGEGNPYDAVEPAARVCGIQTVTLGVDESYTFRLSAWDHDGNLTGTLWSGWEHPDVHYDVAGRPDRQYVSGTNGGSGDHAVFARRYRFSAPGQYEIRVDTLDREEAYGQELFWRVHVE